MKELLCTSSSCCEILAMSPKRGFSLSAFTIRLCSFFSIVSLSVNISMKISEQISLLWLKNNWKNSVWWDIRDKELITHLIISSASFTFLSEQCPFLYLRLSWMKCSLIALKIFSFNWLSDSFDVLMGNASTLNSISNKFSLEVKGINANNKILINSGEDLYPVKILMPCSVILIEKISITHNNNRVKIFVCVSSLKISSVSV